VLVSLSVGETELLGESVSVELGDRLLFGVWVSVADFVKVSVSWVGKWKGVGLKKSLFGSFGFVLPVGELSHKGNPPLGPLSQSGNAGAVPVRHKKIIATKRRFMDIWKLDFALWYAGHPYEQSIRESKTRASYFLPKIYDKWSIR